MKVRATIAKALVDVDDELDRARAKHGALRSPHEALACIREEYLEAEREVFAQRCDQHKLYKELIQLACLCVRTIEDLDLQPSPLDKLMLGGG